jgi:hypothetical protein
LVSEQFLNRHSHDEALNRQQFYPTRKPHEDLRICSSLHGCFKLLSDSANRKLLSSVPSIDGRSTKTVKTAAEFSELDSEATAAAAATASNELFGAAISKCRRQNHRWPRHSTCEQRQQYGPGFSVIKLFNRARPFRNNHHQ